MPSVSKKQHNFMNAVAHNPDFAKKVGVPVSVGKDFSNADKREKLNNPKVNHGDTKYFKEGGSMATKKLFGGKESYSEEKKEAQALKSGKISTKQYIAGEKSEGHKEENLTKTAKDIKSGKMSPTAYAKSEQNEYKCGGKVKRYNGKEGSEVASEKILPEGYDPELAKANRGMAALETEQRKAQQKLDAQDERAKNMARGLMKFGSDLLKPKKREDAYKSGGSVSSASRRGDGIATKGKTRGKIY